MHSPQATTQDQKKKVKFAFVAFQRSEKEKYTQSATFLLLTHHLHLHRTPVTGV